MEEEMLELLWTNHAPIFRYWFTDHRENEKYTDATIGCEGKLYAVHKLVLATCSHYFDQVFEHTEGKHPVLLLHDVKQHELEALLCYMYTGSTSISQLNIAHFMTVAKALQIKGLAIAEREMDIPRPPEEIPLTDNRNHTNAASNCWPERGGIPAPSIPDSSEFPCDYDKVQGEANNSYKSEEDEDAAQHAKEQDQKEMHQYSFQGFTYKNVEGNTDEGLLKRREVLQKIISQTERQLIVEGKTRQDPVNIADTGNTEGPCHKQENKDKFTSKRDPIKKDLEPSPSHSGTARFSKGIVKTKLNGQKKTSVSKPKTKGNKRLYQCKKCSFRGDYLRIKTHMLSHSTVRPYKCCKCTAAFTRKYALHRHQLKHAVVKTGFACTYCSARFANEEFLTNHLDTHDKGKPYLCTICYASFSRKDKLTVHSREHKGKGKGRVTATMKNYAEHDFECNECPATFETHEEYVMHSRTHIIENQFPCTVCPAAFAKKVHLSRHVLTHKGFGSKDKLQDVI